MSVANGLARQDALTKMSRHISSRLDGFTQTFRAEISTPDATTVVTVFTQVTTEVSSALLQGVTTENTDVQMDNRNYRVYVLLSIPVTQVAAELKRQLKEKTDIYTRFGSSRTLKTVDAQAVSPDKRK